MWVYSRGCKDDKTICRKETVQTDSLGTVVSNTVIVQLIFCWSLSAYEWSCMVGQDNQYKGWNGPISTKCLPKSKTSQLIRIIYA